MNMLLNGRYSFFLSSFRAKSQFYNRISCHSALNPHIRYAFPMPLLPVIALSHPQPEDPYLSWLTCCFVKDFFSQLAVCFFTACLVFMRVGWHIVLLLGQEKNVFTTRAGSPTGTHVLSPQLGAVLYKHTACLAAPLIHRAGLENTSLLFWPKLFGQGVAAFVISSFAFPCT